MSGAAPAPASATAPAQDSTPAPRWVRLLLAALIVYAFALRAWYGSVGLDSTRYFDEQFSLRNVSALLVDKAVRPANAFYPSLSYLPQTAALLVSHGLYKLTGIEALAIFGTPSRPAGADGYSRTAYFLCRLVSALFGAASLWAVYRLGKRLVSPAAGLLAAVFFAGLPPHVFASAIFKPDILVALATVLVFDKALDAVLDPTRRRYLVAGAGIGLAVCAKYTGVGVAIPLAFGTLAARSLGADAGWREQPWHRPWARLALAALASIATFALLNPFLFVIVRYIPRLWSIAEGKAEYYDSTPWTVFLRELRFLYAHHGVVVLALAVVGLILFARQALGRREEPWRRVAAVMVLSYVLGYSALYALAGKVFRGQNYIPVAAFTSIGAAWAAVLVWDWLAARAPWLRRPLAAAIAWAAAFALVLWPTAASTYGEVVPSTTQLAARLLVSRFEPVELRQVYYEREVGAKRGPPEKAAPDPQSPGQVAPGQPGEAADAEVAAPRPAGEPLRAEIGERRMLALFAPRLAEALPAELDRSDAEVFAAERLVGPQAGFYTSRISTGREAHRLEPSPFRARGPALVAVLHGWALAGEPEPLALVPVAAETPAPEAATQGDDGASTAGARSARSTPAAGAGPPSAPVGDEAPSASPELAAPAAGGGNRYRAELASPIAAGEVVSLSLWLPLERGRRRQDEFLLGDTRVALYDQRVAGRRVRYLTARLELPPGTTALDFTLDPELVLEAPPRAELNRWRR